MLRDRRNLFPLIFGLVLSAPVWYFGKPLFLFFPDIQYVKAKILRVMAGNLLADPVTAYPTFHPPWYHWLLSLPARAGLDIDFLLLVVSVANVCLICLFVYMILKRIFGEPAAVGTTLMVPFIFAFMGPDNLLLATSFYFSLPFFLAGLWLYLKGAGEIKRDILVAALWGLAFLFSPVYLFLILFLLAWEIVAHKKYKRAGVMVVTLGIVSLPFFVQAVIVSNNQMTGSSAFSFWRGLPGWAWWRDLIISFLSPSERNVFRWPALLALALTAAGAVSWIQGKHRPYLPALAAGAYFLTAYHFNFQYAARIQLFLCLFLVAGLFQFLTSPKRIRVFAYVLISALTATGLINHLVTVSAIASDQHVKFQEYQRVTAGLCQNFPRLVPDDSHVLATDFTFRTYVMPHFPVYGLVAYRTGEYFQLKTAVAEEILADFHRLMRCPEQGVIDSLCRVYDIEYAVATETADMQMPGIRTLSTHWRLLYADGLFRIYQRPGFRRGLR